MRPAPAITIDEKKCAARGCHLRGASRPLDGSEVRVNGRRIKACEPSSTLSTVELVHADIDHINLD
jgi:hypothetical protein